MQSRAHHGVVLLQDLHVMNELVLLLAHPLVVHSVKVPLLAEFVPGGRRLHAYIVGLFRPCGLVKITPTALV